MTILLHELAVQPDLNDVEHAAQIKILAALSERNFRLVYKHFYDLGAALDFTDRVMRPMNTGHVIDPLNAPLELLAPESASDTAPEPEVATDVEMLPHHTDETGEIHVQEALEKLKKVAPVTALIPGVPTEEPEILMDVPDDSPAYSDSLEDSGLHVKVELREALTSLEDLLEGNPWKKKDGGK